MRLPVFSLLLASALSLAACNKCKDIQHVERTKLMEAYFGNYKPGAYWIYLNRDSTKRDSIWIDDYKTQKKIDKLDQCLEADEYFFYLHNKYLGLSEVWGIGIRKNDFYTNIFEASPSTNYNLIIRFLANDDLHDFYYGSNTYPETVNYFLWQNNTTTILPRAVKIDNLVFSPNIGLVQYMPDNSTDTFSLIKYYVP